MGRVRPSWIFLLAAVTLFAAGALMPARAQTAEEAALSDAQRRIDAVAEQIRTAEGVEAEASARLAEADARLAEVEAAVNQAAAAIERQRHRVVESERLLAELAAEVEGVHEAFGLRAADMYKHGTSLPFEVLLTAGDIQAALERSEFVRVVTGTDQARLEQVSNARIALAGQQDRHDAELARLERMRLEHKQLLAQVAQMRQQRQLELAAARAEVAGLEESMDNLEDAVEGLKRLIAERQKPVTSIVPSTSGYVWPRCDRVTSGFGRRWGRMHEGLDIDGETGQPIGAVKDGVVIFAGWHGGYGQMVLIDHGDGVVSAYAHQSRLVVTEGQTVIRAQQVGDVGSTGSSTGSHLHFETRVNGAAVDPLQFLPPSC
ncbi:MAG: peptidoglycan DD-metalloendopeptidase family protein [Actinobacteria bacterium]|nr:peptidoglycan DD-metalloendopeptidase family protein [Actinomycetota bacterium]